MGVFGTCSVLLSDVMVTGGMAGDVTQMNKFLINAFNLIYSFSLGILYWYVTDKES